MAWKYLLSPTFQVVNTAGKPATGGYIEVYIHGTRDRYYCASDFDGTLHPFKIPLDSLGANIVLADDSQTYDVYVYNRYGSLIMSRYDVPTVRGKDSAYSGDVSDATISFTTSSTRTNIATGEKLTVLFGKIKKWFTDLNALAFKNKADLASDVSGILRIENGGTGAGTVVGARSNLDVYSKSEVESLLAGRIVFVTVLPTTGEAGKIYYLEVDTNVYDTYIWGYAPGATEESWILTGRQELDLDDYKKKQRPYSKTGSKTKTITALSQDANGEIDATFEDIEIPESVPNVEITSPNNTISVSSSEDPQTNTKTFSIDVNHKPLSIGGFTASMSVVNWNFRAQHFTLGNIGLQGDKIGYNPTTQYISLAVGTYELSARYIVTWSGTPQNKVVYIGNVPFDLSYNHSQEIDRTYVTKLSSSLSSLILILQPSEEPPTGLTCELSALYIHSLEQVLENVVQGLQSVTTDDTLTGDGTTENPLSVVVDNTLDADSENPVQNKVLYGVIGDVESLLEDL